VLELLRSALDSAGAVIEGGTEGDCIAICQGVTLTLHEAQKGEIREFLDARHVNSGSSSQDVEEGGGEGERAIELACGERCLTRICRVLHPIGGTQKDKAEDTKAEPESEIADDFNLDLGALNCGACSSNAEVYQEAKFSEKAEEESARERENSRREGGLSAILEQEIKRIRESFEGEIQLLRKFVIQVCVCVCLCVCVCVFLRAFCRPCPKALQGQIFLFNLSTPPI